MTARPSTETEPMQTEEELAAQVAKLAEEGGQRIAVAESLTAGRVSSMLGRGERASEWYRGAVVAYDEDVKFRVLGVTPGPVVTDLCAREMAEGVRRLLRADVALGELVRELSARDAG
ncbi:CinA domain protein (fragment) [metagenome]|uniref:CinA domain protein n=1 Tax=metagenome TaxID=256318 RepID=A0A2P2CK78_9ZZZZ